MNIVIRPITAEDYPFACEMLIRTNRVSFGKIYPSMLIEEFCKKYNLDNFTEKAKDTDYFVAVDSDSEKHAILGLIGLKRNELRTFFVDPNFQGQGIGRKLYNHLEKIARDRGIEELELQGSPLGEEVYKKFGFKKVKTIHKEKAGVTYSDAHMVKKL